MTIGIPESYWAERQRNCKPPAQRRLVGMVTGTQYRQEWKDEPKKGRQPDYKGEGVAVWIEKDKNGKDYLSGVIMNSLRFKAFKNEPRE